MPVKPMDILVVDDDEACRSELERLLSGHGHRVHCASDVSTALRVADLLSPQLIISDVNLPGPSGIDLLRSLKSSDSGVAVVLMTGNSEAADTAAAFQLGASGFLQKPVRAEALLDGIRRLQKA